jgi:hypothetical protein
MKHGIVYRTKQIVHRWWGYFDYRRCLLDPQFRANLARLRTFQDRHRGQRCFIIGNGPSLKQTDLSLLQDEYTFGLNRIYLLFDEMGFSTKYYISINRLVLEQFAGEIAAQVPCPRFTSWEHRDIVRTLPDMHFVYRHNAASFSRDVTRGVWGGTTVTYVAMQLAFYMGFQKVILIGVDHSFATKGKAHTTVISEGGDPNHFDPSYFGKGVRWQLPDLDTSEFAYGLARKNYKDAGREIVDATIGGQLQVFEKIDFYSLFDRI